MKNTPYKKEFNDLGQLVNPLSSYSEDGYLNHFPNRSQRRAQNRAMLSRGKFNNRSVNRINVVGSVDENGKPIFYKMKKTIQRVGNKTILHSQVIN